jgi:hypothetical protein
LNTAAINLLDRPLSISAGISLYYKDRLENRLAWRFADISPLAWANQPLFAFDPAIGGLEVKYYEAGFR